MSDRRRFVVGCVLGALPALVVFVWLVTAGSADLLAKEPFGAGAFDAQATALLHGHWDVSRIAVGFDAFQIGSKYYMYFGVWPSILRMPVLALFGSQAGRLTVPSMLLAFAVLLGGAGALFWRIRSLTRGDVRCSRADAAIAGVVVFAIGCGSTAIFLASRAIVYHEAILWAVAWALLAFERIIAFTQRPSLARLAVAAACTTLSILSRVSIGMGPVLALGLLAAIELWRVFARRRSPASKPSSGRSMTDRVEPAGVRDPSGRTWLWWIAFAALVPIGAYAWMNYSRFGSLFGIPWRSQIIAGLSPEHRAMLDANGGSLFGLKLIPTTLLQALRPDALGASPVFPWVTFQRFPTPVIGDAVFNRLDFTTSVTASMPALVLLAGIGVVAVLWTRVLGTRDAAVLRAPLLGAAGGAAVSLAFTFVAARYLGDWLPLLIIGGLVGLEVVLFRRRSATRRRRWNAVLVVVAVFAVFGVWANFSLGLLYQRLYSPPRPGLRAEMLSFQYRLSDGMGRGLPDLVESPRLPSGRASAGTTWIVGRCDAMYWSDGRTWQPVEGKPSEGWVRARADFAGVGAEWSPLVGFGPRGGQDVVGVLREPGGLRFGLGRPDSRGDLVWTPAFVTVRVRPGAQPVAVLADRVNESLSVTIHGRYVLTLSSEPTSANPVRVARGPVSVGRAATGSLQPFPGAIRRTAASVGSCERIRRLAGHE